VIQIHRHERLDGLLPLCFGDRQSADRFGRQGRLARPAIKAAGLVASPTIMMLLYAESAQRFPGRTKG
jgi:hypothetical protein